MGPLSPRLRVVPHVSSGIVEWAKRERAWKSPHAFSRVGDFHARSRFARSTIPEEKWGLLVVYLSPTPLLYFLDSLPCASLGDVFCPFFPTRGPGSRLMKMCANAANAPPRKRSNGYVCKFTLGANVHGRHGRNVFTARVIGSCEWQIIPTLYLKHNFDGKFPIVRAK